MDILQSLHFHVFTLGEFIIQVVSVAFLGFVLGMGLATYIYK
jgi:hypothetical protein